jgi:putative transposase
MIEIAVPRGRNSSSFEPQIVAKGQTHLEGFDGRIISLSARGLSVREIQAHLEELYGVEVSPDLISRVTDAVFEEVREWQKPGLVIRPGRGSRIVGTAARPGRAALRG